MITDIVIPKINKEEIIGVLKEKEPSKMLIIVCHGYNSSKEHPALASITNKLYDMGHSVFSFTFSRGARGIHVQQQIADIKDIVSYFRKYSSIIILAGSFGALDGAIATTKLSKITGLITVNGFFGSSKLGFNYLKIFVVMKILSFFIPSYRKIWKYLQKNYQPENIMCDTLVLHAKHDEGVSFAQSQEFFKKIAGKKEFHILENADHHLTKESYRQEVADVIDKWLKGC